MLHGQKRRVEHNAQRYGQLKERISHHLIETVLKLQPALIVGTAVHTAIAVTIGQIICERKIIISLSAASSSLRHTYNDHLGGELLMQRIDIVILDACNVAIAFDEAHLAWRQCQLHG